MYILIGGGGQVGYYLAKGLLQQGHEVLLLEKDGRRVRQLSEELGTSVARGDACEARTLAEVGCDRADMVAAVTGDDEDNLVICQVAKGRFNVPRTVARVNNPRNEFIFSRLGIDATVSATQVILAMIQQSIPQHPFVHLLTLQEGGIEFVELLVEPGSPAVDQPASALSLPPDTALPLLIRQGQPVVVQGDTEIKANDRLLAITTSQQEGTLRTQILG